MEAVIDNLQDKVTTLIAELDIFSDGATQHFKSKYMFMWASSLLEKKGILVSWHFSATSHGKGAVDGIGGTMAPPSGQCSGRSKSVPITSTMPSNMPSMSNKS